MAVELIEPKDHAHWLEMRKRDVTSSDAAALFHMSPYTTLFELWHQKKSGQALLPFDENARVKWGSRLEPVIAAGIAEDRGWRIKPLKLYAHDPVHHMGASFDFEILGDPRGPGVLEIKNVDSLVFRDKWSPDEPPDHIEVQLQAQLAVLEPLDYTWGAIGALVGGNSPVVVERSLDKAVALGLRRAVANFWLSIEANQAPEPVLPDDTAAIMALYRDCKPGAMKDLRGIAEAAEFAAAYKSAAAEEKAAVEKKNTAKAQLIQMIGDAEKAILDGFTISAGTVAGATFTTTRQPYRGFRVNAAKAVKTAKADSA